MNDLINREAAINAAISADMENHSGILSEKRARVIESHINTVPHAQPERKKGEWVKVHGYATPGGDPVWACSECGKGIHVYGIEHRSYGNDIADGQWVACPNCGVEMLGGEQWGS